MRPSRELSQMYEYAAPNCSQPWARLDIKRRLEELETLGTVQYAPAPRKAEPPLSALTPEQSRLVSQTAEHMTLLVDQVKRLEAENQRLFVEMERWRVEAHQTAEEKYRLEEEAEDAGNYSMEEESGTLLKAGSQVDAQGVQIKAEPSTQAAIDDTVLDTQPQDSHPPKQNIPPILPSIEHPAKPEILYAVIHRYEPLDASGESICELKGTFSFLDAANDTAIAVFNEAYPNCKYMDVLEKGRSNNPWQHSDGDIGLAQRRLGKEGEVRFAVDEEMDGVGYVVVIRQELDVRPGTSELPTEVPLAAPPPKMYWEPETPAPSRGPFYSRESITGAQPEGPPKP